MDISLSKLRCAGERKIINALFPDEASERLFSTDCMALQMGLRDIKVLPFSIPKMWEYLEGFTAVDTKKFSKWAIRTVPSLAMGECNISIQRRFRDVYTILWGRFFEQTGLFADLGGLQTYIMELSVKFIFYEKYLHDISDSETETFDLNTYNMFKRVNTFTEAVYSLHIACDELTRASSEDMDLFFYRLLDTNNADFVVGLLE